MIKIFKRSEDRKTYTGKAIIISIDEFYSNYSSGYQFIRTYENGMRIATRLGLGGGKAITEYSSGAVLD